MKLEKLTFAKRVESHCHMPMAFRTRTLKGLLKGGGYIFAV
jgi:hypothetical protein